MIRPPAARRAFVAATLVLAPLCSSAGTASADPPIVPMPGDPDSPVISRRNDMRNHDDFGNPAGKTFPENTGTLHASVQTADPLPQHERPIITR